MGAAYGTYGEEWCGCGLHGPDEAGARDEVDRTDGDGWSAGYIWLIIAVSSTGINPKPL
ncbi:hypothetical protein MA16_Dca003963 [Dendrobium catenatum]|uniref:Uncharacterized protein n=1 Tax=Dendrobium catenatum TaxID=906689 RepID=A0A2I0X207_9ASPA|nr:hypothetical protein MA16_Dca003963 [Dendrobium catenatum]